MLKLKYYILAPAMYLAFVWQATLRSDMAWHGYAPNFLTILFVVALWILDDVPGLLIAAVLGLLSDSLTSHHLGCDTLCFVVIAALLQVLCPPRLVRHPAWLPVLVCAATWLVEITTTALRATLNHELPESAAYAEVLLSWGVRALGDSCYSALLMTLPLLVLSICGQRLRYGERSLGNSWHRLTS